MEKSTARVNKLRLLRLKSGLCACGRSKPINGNKSCSYCRNERIRRDSLIRIAVIRFYGRKCACCGEREINFLCIDHISGGGNIHKREIGKTGSGFYKWIIRNKFPTGFRVLCHNCNHAVWVLGKCPGNGHLGLQRETI